MMKRRILQTIVALLAIAGSATAQSLTVQGLEAKAGEQTTLTVSLSGAAAMTALQFNLTLPEGVTLDETNITKGSGASGYELAIRLLADGSRLFVLYNMDKAMLTNGELLRLPVSVGSVAGTKKGKITKIRTASTEAVSHAAVDAVFTITVKEEEQPVTITADDKTMTYGDNVPTLTYKSSGAALKGTPKLSTTAKKPSPVGT